MITYYFLIVIFTAPSLIADCLTCTQIHTEHGPNGEYRDIYTKKCLAKQKDIEGDVCEYCKCSRNSHSVNRHPYKVHNGRKITPQSFEEAYRAQREHRSSQHSLVSRK